MAFHKRLIKKEKEERIKTATKVYFSMINMFDYIVSHYLYEDSLKTVYLCENWVEEVAKLRVRLSNKEVKQLFDMFRNIEILDSKKETEDYYKYVLRFCNKFFIDDLICLSKNRTDIDIREKNINLLKYDYFVLVSKIQILADGEEITDEKLSICNKPIKIYYTNNKKEYECEYQGNNKYKIKIYDSDGNVLEDVEKENGKTTGYMEKYENNRLIEKGEYENNTLINGVKYHVYKDNDYSCENEEDVGNTILDSDETNYIGCDRYYREVAIVNGKENKEENEENYVYEIVPM